jgi:hypothetical protein
VSGDEAGSGAALVRLADTDVGLDIGVPTGWDAVSTASFPLALVAPEEELFRANIGVLVGTLEPASVEGFESRIANLRASRTAELPAFAIRSERVGPQNGYPGWQMRATWDFEGRTVTQVTVVFVTENEALYELTGTTLLRLEEQYLPIFRQVFGSLKVLPAAG